MASTSGARNIYRLYVHNVPWTVSHNELKKFFSQFGHVYSATVIFDKKTGLSRNYGFVNYSTKEGYETALNSNNLNLEGQVLRTEPSDKS